MGCAVGAGHRMPFDNCPEHERATDRAGTGDFGKRSGTGTGSATPEQEGRVPLMIMGGGGRGTPAAEGGIPLIGPLLFRAIPPIILNGEKRYSRRNLATNTAQKGRP